MMPRGERYEWTPEAIALVEDTSLPGRDVAALLDVSQGLISKYRREYGINVKGAHFRWTVESEALLYDSTLSNSEVAKQVGCNLSQALRRRDALGIWDYPSLYGTPIEWPDGIKDRLGTVLDKVIADEVGCSVTSIFLLRRSKGIRACMRPVGRVTPKGLGHRSREASRIYKARRKHRKRGILNTLTWEQWDFTCEWFDDCCAYCGSDGPLGEDHRVPLSEGGPRTALNILPCCSSCNSSKWTSKVQDWIYWKFGREKGQEIIENIVAYLTEVQALGG